jgi:hypothetical protein
MALGGYSSKSTVALQGIGKDSLEKIHGIKKQQGDGACSNMSSRTSHRSRRKALEAGVEDGKKRKTEIEETAEEDENGEPVKRAYTFSGAPIGRQAGAPSGQSSATASSVTAVSANSTWSRVTENGLNAAGKLHIIKKFVKEMLFPHVKFVTGKQQMRWETAPGSIAQFVMKGLNIPGDAEMQRDWWENHSELISKELNRKRSDVVAGLKKVFLGTYALRERPEVCDMYAHVCCILSSSLSPM